MACAAVSPPPSATKSLVIDPTLTYSTFLGGNGEDPAYGIATDPAGNVLVRYQGPKADATRPLAVYEKARESTGGRLFDLVVNCASVPGTEMGSILAARDGGEVLFFSMATSFTAAALGAEGAGKDVRLTIGNGYARGHAELALELLRSTPALQRLFAARVG